MPAPNEWQCQQFVAVVEQQGTEGAANYLTAQRGQRYHRQSVEKTIARIEQWYGAPLLKRGPGRKLYPTAEGQLFLDAARSVITEYKIMRGSLVPPGVPVLACQPHHTHFVTIAETLLLREHPKGTDKVVVRYLEQQHRAESHFHTDTLARLRRNRYHLIIGPAVADQVAFESIGLYSAQLEAMLPAPYPASAISLTDLVRHHRMMLPPPDMRSRRLLEESITRWGIEDSHREHRIAAETYETVTSVMRLRAESTRGLDGPDSRVVVAPSDVALAFKPGMEFAGRNADRFVWVPIYHRDDGGAEHLLRLETCVTVRRDRARDPRLAPIITTLRQAVSRLEEDSAVGLSGEAFPHPRSGAS